MERKRFAELVEYLEERFGVGAMDAWSHAASVYSDFENLDSDLVWEALLAKLDADPKAEFPPKPPALRASTLERMRHKPRPELPETTEKYPLTEWLRRHHPGKTVMDVVREKADAESDGRSG